MRLLISYPHQVYRNTYPNPNTAVEKPTAVVYLSLLFCHIFCLLDFKDFEGISFSILEVYQQKSLNLPDNTTMSVSLHNYNFERNLFSGDPSQAHHFIPFLQPKLGEAKLSNILKADAIPHPECTQTNKEFMTRVSSPFINIASST